MNEEQIKAADIEISRPTLVQDGFTFKLPKRSAAIWFYRVKDK